MYDQVVKCQRAGLCLSEHFLYFYKSNQKVIFPFSALTLLGERQEGHPACNKSGCWFVGGDDLTGALHDL